MATPTTTVTTHAAATDASAGWGRRRLLAVLGLVAALVVCLLGGLGYAVYDAVGTAERPGAPEPSEAAPSQAEYPRSGMARRDAIAAAPMRRVPAAAARPTAPAATLGPTIRVPAFTEVGAAGVPTGFPHTARGAVGQWAAIGTTVLQQMSIAGVNRVHQTWTLPGAPTVTRWQMTHNVQAFLGAAQMGPAMAATATVVATPAAAQVKGTDGPDWVLACVLWKVQATITTTAQIGYGHCARMQWHQHRWMIAPGAEPAPAPSTWPGSDLAREAGWRHWTSATHGPG